MGQGKKRNRFRNIYFDPSSEKKLEGKAYLVNFIKEDEQYQYWEVRFVGDTELITRKFYTHPPIKYK